MKVTNILIVIPNLGKGGAQRVFHQQFGYLGRKFSVHGCVFNWDGSFDSDRMEDIVSLDVPAGITWFDKMYFFILRVIRLRKLKKELQIDVSISHLEGADYVNLFSRRSDKIVCWIHGSKKYDGNIKGILGLVRMYILMPFIYGRSDKIVTVSDGIQEELKRIVNGLQSKLSTIYNGFDIDLIQAHLRESVEPEFSALASESKLIVTHARLSIQKNLETLIEIFSVVYKTLPSKLVIIGEGELSDALIRQSDDLGLKTWSIWRDGPFNNNYDVYFFGQKENPFKYLKFASLYIMTSAWEGFPLAICEAMICNVPVISTDCFTGPREILAPGIELQQPVGIPHYGKFGVLMPLVNNNDEVSMKIWAETVQSMMTNEELLRIYSEVGIECIQNFSLKSAISSTIETIQSLG